MNIMNIRETPFLETDGWLIMVKVVVVGPLATIEGRFALDTGATVTTMIPQIAAMIGYARGDAFRSSRVRSPIGDEKGYLVHAAEFEALGFLLPRVAVNVLDLGFEDIDGLVGMNFLNDFNYEIRSAEHRILAEKIAA